MVDLKMDGSGNTTTSGTVSFVAPRQDINDLKRKIDNQQRQIDLQEQKIEILERHLKLARASKSVDNNNFTKEELAFILSRVHPDKNPNSNIATTLTSKLIKGRNT